MSNYFKYFSLGMGVLFIIMSFIIMIYPPEVFKQYPDYGSVMFSVALFAYGLFRLSRAVKAIKNAKNDESENQQ